MADDGPDTASAEAGGGMAADAGEDAGPARPAAPADGPRMVTPARRRAMVGEARAAQRAAVRQATSAVTGAWAGHAHRLAPHVAGLPAASRDRIGVPVDPSHRLVACGGFVGCIVCGGVNGLLRGSIEQQCRGPCARRNAGDVLRLCRGLLPRGRRAWPSGTAHPMVVRLV